MKYFTYMLLCADGSYYTGYTTDLERRLSEHNGESEGKGAKYTRCRRPCKLVWYEEFGSKNEAMSKEWHLKRLNHSQKSKLISEKGLI
ncbi:GIY-YIG nuclease family protein [Lachnospiraceae bacterium C1.1]|nr:GIY-YIG nuclease family protein [Lachnospiraceae bacterium C1.1]